MSAPADSARSPFDRFAARGLSQARLAAPAVAGGVAFVAYVRTLMPGIAFGDAGELQTVPHVLGIAHPTGYPTYILLAWLAELIPIGSVAFRANLLSAAYVAVAIATVTLVSLRLGVRPMIAIGAGLALGATGTVWAAATVADVDPLNLALAALIFHRALAWQETRSTTHLAIGGLLVGLAFGNHLVVVFIAPFVALFVAWTGRREIMTRPVIVLVGAGAVLLGLSVYLYIPLAARASPPLPYNHPVTLDGVLWLASGAQFRGLFDFLSSKGPGNLVAALPDLWDLLASRATPVLPVVGLVGLGILVVKRPAIGLLCLSVFLSTVYLWANFLTNVHENYLLVPWFLLALGAALGIESAIHGLSKLARWLAPDASRAVASASAALGATVGLAAVAGGVGLLAMNWTGADRSADRSGQEYVDAVFTALPPNAAILSYWDASTPLWYGQHVEGRRPDVLIVDDTNIVYEGWVTRERRIASLICQRPVFILRLGDADLIPTRQQFRLTPFLTVLVAAGEPTAGWSRDVYRVEPLDAGAC